MTSCADCQRLCRSFFEARLTFSGISRDTAGVKGNSVRASRHDRAAARITSTLSGPPLYRTIRTPKIRCPVVFSTSLSVWAIAVSASITAFLTSGVTAVPPPSSCASRRDRPRHPDVSATKLSTSSATPGCALFLQAYACVRRGSALYVSVRAAALLSH